MNNKETLQSYNNRLNANNITLDNIIETIDTLPEAKEVVLQDKTIEITENGTQTIKADSGYDGLNEVEVITNVASSGGEAPEKGLIINKCDEKGIATEVTIKGLSEIPNYYLGYFDARDMVAMRPSKIVFDETITKIGERAFMKLTSLKELGSTNGGNPFENITIIGGEAFSGCSGFSQKSICLPNLTTLAIGYVFQGANSARYMWIGDKITDLPAYSFYGQALRKLYINLPRATVETFSGYAEGFIGAPTSSTKSHIICNDDDGFITKEQFDAIDWATYIG